MLQAPIKTVKLARRLRKEMSHCERLLWWALKERPGDFIFRKQCPQGPFSLDFACLAARLAIEVDGEAHGRGDRPARDEKRDRYIAEAGFLTIRIPAAEVFSNLEGVVMGIVEQCRARGPLHPPAAPGVLARDRVPRTRSWTAGGSPKRQHPPRSGEEQE